MSSPERSPKPKLSAFREALAKLRPSKKAVPDPARVKPDEHGAAVASLVRRGGRFMPGEPVKQYPPGFTPPWERSRRPVYAIGHDECPLDD